MKRFISAMLAVILTIGMFSASAEGKLGNFFKNLIEQGISAAGDNASSAPSDGKLQGVLTYANEKALKKGKVLDISPDGSTFVVLSDDGVYVYRNGKFKMISISYERGVTDEYDSLSKLERMVPYFIPSLEGLAWSSDGRYAVFTNNYRVMMYADFNIKLFILDAETGEVFLGNTWSDSYPKGGAAVVAACFDEMGENIYYMVYGKADATRNSLYRYNMATGENERLAGYDGTCYPGGMFMTKEGAVFHLDQQPIMDTPAYATLYSEFMGTWLAQVAPFGVPMRYLTPSRILFSREAGQGMILSRSQAIMNGSYSFITTFNAGEMITGLDSILLIPKGANQAVRKNAAETFNAMKPLDNRLSDSSAPVKYDLSMENESVFNVALSPDGKYALVLSGMTILEARLSLMDMETLSLTPVSVPEGVVSMNAGFNTPMGRYFPAGMQWFTDDLVVFCTEEGPVLMNIR